MNNPTPTGLMPIRAVQPGYEELYERRPAPSCWVYEVWDTQGRLAYVGIADDFAKRWAQHLRMSWWLGEIDVWYVEVFGYRTRWEARQVEACVINEQNPVYNTSRETGAYLEYLRLNEDESRPVDEFDCVPMRKLRFAPIDCAVA